MLSLSICAGLFSLPMGESAPLPDGSSEPFVVVMAEGSPTLHLPRNEELVYRAEVSLGPLDTEVGLVSMKSSVEPYREPLLGGGGSGGAGARETGVLTIHAKGTHALYSMDARIDTRILPQKWPHFQYTYVHKGTERRRREVLIGQREESRQAGYRKDTSRGAPEGTRIWRDWEYREVPEGAVDMLSAVYWMRALFRDDLDRFTFPLIDKRRLWEMEVRRGETRRIRTRAGTFEAVRVVLKPGPFPGEDLEDKEERFQGLFGLEGSIQLWVEASTGVPLRIQGDLPVAFVTLKLDIELERFSGTPPRFRPIPVEGD